jgi:hypothetical protein
VKMSLMESLRKQLEKQELESQTDDSDPAAKDHQPG